jgi:hypothetical protein
VTEAGVVIMFVADAPRRFGQYMTYLMANKCHITDIRRISAQENSNTQQGKMEAVQS